MNDGNKTSLPYRVIVCATDGSEHSKAAGAAAAGLAAATGARLVGVYVVDQHAATRLGIYYSHALHEMAQEGRHALDELARAAQAAGDVPFQPILAEGIPKRDIVEIAREQGAGLLVVGSHGRTGLERALMGSVAEFAVRHAPCDVLVVRRRTVAQS